MKTSTILFFAIALLAPSLASAKGADKKAHAQEPAKPLPSYEEVVNSYPDAVPLCPTEADIVGGDDQGLSLEGGSIATNEDGVQRYQCYGTKLTVRKKVTLKGKTYQPGAKLTVDKDLYWIQVSGWQASAPKFGATVSSSGADPQKAPADVASPSAGAEKTASGLASKVLRAGSGATHPSAWDEVTVNYTGWTTDGKMFDTSAAKGEPPTFALGKVIAGVDRGPATDGGGREPPFLDPGQTGLWRDAWSGQAGRHAGVRHRARDDHPGQEAH
jgi:hypothetical protein